jgi:hypothetical protein
MNRSLGLKEEYKMQDVYYTGWALVLITTIVLMIAHIGLHHKETKFTVPVKAIPLTMMTGLFFWVALQLFSVDKTWMLILIPFATGLIMSLLIQTFTPKAETAMGLLSFLPFLFIYKYFSDDMLYILGLFTVGMLVGVNLRLLRAEKYLGNALVSAAIILPVYAGITWMHTILPSEKLVSQNILTLIVVTLIAFAYSFAINLLGEDKHGNKRQAALIITVLLIWLLNNYLTLDPKIIYLLAGGFVFAQILEVINLKKSEDAKSYTLEAFMGLGLILVAGFIVTRLFGIWGLILVSLCCSATSSINAEKTLNWPAIAAMFYSVKAIVHVFIEQTTLNVTGLNLNHPYVYVGLIIGLLIPFMILGFTAAYKHKFWGYNFLIIGVFGLITPLMSNYLIHTEASGAMILGLSVSALVANIGGKILGNIFDNKDIKVISNAMLSLAGLMGIMLILNQNLIDLGNLASRAARAEAFVVVAIIVILTAVAQLDVTGHTEEEFYPEKNG